MAATSDWRGALGRDWARHDEMMGAMLRPFGDAALAALGKLRGRAALDLGCGGGETTFALEQAVGPKGVALGVDVSPDLVALAAARRRALGARAGFLCADAARLSLGRPFDALYSRFGAMFFDRPTDAFARLRAAMRPGARLSIVCWRGLKENDWAFAPLVAATPHLPVVAPPPPGAPGPFAWARPEESFAPVLARAGWRRVRWTALDLPVIVGAGLPGDPVAAAAESALAIGPVAARLAGADDATRRRVRAAVEAAFADRLEGGAVTVNGACWLVRARA